jgi:hypothetical protein
MRTFREDRDRMQELADLAVGVAMAEHRQPERGLGDEHVAWDQLERHAGRVGDVLVVAGGDDPQPVAFDRDLRGPEHMSGRMEGRACAVERDRLAVADGLRAAGEILAVA